MKIELTDRQAEAALDILNERLAGGVDDLRDALGLDKRQAGETFRAAERVVAKIQAAKGTKGETA